MSTHDPLYPYVRVSKIQKKLEEYRNNSLNEQDENENSYGYIAGPLKKSNKTKRTDEPEKIVSGQIIDPNIAVHRATGEQRNLLSKAGLSVTDADDVRVINNKDGALKAAISITKDKLGNIEKIHYIDTDQNDDHFKKALFKLNNIPGGIKIEKQKYEVVKEEINPVVLVDD